MMWLMYKKNILFSTEILHLFAHILKNTIIINKLKAKIESFFYIFFYYKKSDKLQVTQKML